MQVPPDFTQFDIDVLQRVGNYTMTSAERIVSLISAVKYVIKNKIEGDFVECGVWRGGSMMAIALTLLELGVHDRKLYLFDTFQGMPQPGAPDISFDGIHAAKQMDQPVVQAYAGLQDVMNALATTGYPPELTYFAQGRVEDSVPLHAPERIALLRLDTDWYESTRHELIHLYPRLTSQGVLIIDDYGHWQGARKAVDEYFENGGPLLSRIDYTGRLAIKP